jgi:hypothetical protein
MNPVWPSIEVIKDFQVAPDGSVATAHTELYLQGRREHLYTSTMLIAVDLLLTKFLNEGEQLASLAGVQLRNLSNHNLVLTTAVTRSKIPGVQSPAVRGWYRTSQDRILWFEGTLADERISRREESPGVIAEMMQRMHLEKSRTEGHRTRLETLAEIYRDCSQPLLIRCAILDFVLEATRQLIRERFGDLGGDRLVVAGLRDFVFPPWQEVAHGCLLEYRLSDGRLSSGTQLVHCDFSFSPNRGVGRLTIARVPGAKMRALRSVPER